MAPRSLVGHRIERAIIIDYLGKSKDSSDFTDIDLIRCVHTFGPAIHQLVIGRLPDLRPVSSGLTCQTRVQVRADRIIHSVQVPMPSQYRAEIYEGTIKSGAGCIALMAAIGHSHE